jgi:hypothetical protein
MVLNDGSDIDMRGRRRKKYCDERKYRLFLPAEIFPKNASEKAYLHYLPLIESYWADWSPIGL